MRILLTGEEHRAAEIRPKFDSSHQVHIVDIFAEMEIEELEDYDLIIDLNADDNPSNFEMYSQLEDKAVIVCSVKMQLAEMVFTNGDAPLCRLAGMNALPAFLGRDKAEISLYKKEDKSFFDDIFSQIGWKYHVVEDRVGMVSPRIVFMIINEAFYTLQEGTATADDIDESMKLGTNYPYGPFEWCERTGIRDVYETLEALYQDTHDERYKVCPLLKTRYLQNMA